MLDKNRLSLDSLHEYKMSCIVRVILCYCRLACMEWHELFCCPCFIHFLLIILCYGYLLLFAWIGVCSSSFLYLPWVYDTDDYKSLFDLFHIKKCKISFIRCLLNFDIPSCLFDGLYIYSSIVKQSCQIMSVVSGSYCTSFLLTSCGMLC